MNQIIDMNIGEPIRLPSLNKLRDEKPLSASSTQLVLKSRQIIQDIILGKDKRQLLVVGPCSVHNLNENLEFARLLKTVIDLNSSNYYIVMRVCTDKPRTKKDWRGWILDPHLDGSFHAVYGYESTRQLMLDILDLGIPVACEMMNINNYNIVSDIVSYAWIGARDSTSSGVRDSGSAVTAPIGVKNSNAKDTFDDAVNALDVVTSPGFIACADNDGYHSLIPTKGNRYAHIILRGSPSGPNYSPNHVSDVCQQLQKAGFIDRVLIDCSHGNSKGEHLRQLDIFQDVVQRIKKGEKGIIGTMMEVYLDDGKQAVKLGQPDSPAKIKPRLSVTDNCLSFENFYRVFRKNM
jgi:3-deoxy-7-phosphoheptulonate synthase